jgi:hypothetical protein
MKAQRRRDAPRAAGIHGQQALLEILAPGGGLVQIAFQLAHAGFGLAQVGLQLQGLQCQLLGALFQPRRGVGQRLFQLAGALVGLDAEFPGFFQLPVQRFTALPGLVQMVGQVVVEHIGLHAGCSASSACSSAT